MYLKTVTIRGEGAQLLESTFSITKGPLFNTVLKCQGMHACSLSGYDPDSNGNNNNNNIIIIM